MKHEFEPMLVNVELILILPAAWLVSFVLTWLARRVALAQGLLDIPNERSSHVVPTPRGGGVAIVIATSVALLVLFLVDSLAGNLFAALGGGGIAVAVVGYLDDRRKLSARTRLMVHFAAALWALAWLGGMPPLQWGDELVRFGGLSYVLGAVGIVWCLNLFNFMDGIDGIAASEAVFVSCAGAMIAVWCGSSFAMPAAALVLAAACAGFLSWNWPPAKIFMGDAGSGYLGYTIAVLALIAARDQPVALLVWLILGGLFFVDATVTLVRRVARGERSSVAHRSHAYQWLARRWGSHRRVTMLTMLLNVAWLLPCALLAARFPHWGALIAMAALAPLVIGAVVAGAGSRERSNS